MWQDDNACSHPFGNCSSSRNVRVKRYFRGACQPIPLTHVASTLCALPVLHGDVLEMRSGPDSGCMVSRAAPLWISKCSAGSGLSPRVPRMPNRPRCRAGSAPALLSRGCGRIMLLHEKKRRDVSVFPPRRYLPCCNRTQASASNAIAGHLAIAAPPDFRT